MVSDSLVRMLMRVLAITLFLAAGIAVQAAPHSFVATASGRLGKPIRFEFFRGSTKGLRTEVKSFTVSTRTEDFKWRAMWSIVSAHSVIRQVQYGVTPRGFTTMINPEKLVPGRVYAASAIDGHGGSASITFGFDTDGIMIFPDSYDR